VVFVWSPDSRWVGFTANRKFQKIEVAGGSAPQVICECVAGTATWNNEGTIIFATREQPLQFVRASGDKPAPVFGLDVTRGETWQGTPDFLPYGKHFIYDSFAKERGAVLASLDGRTRRFLAPIDGVARFAPNPSGGGWLLYVINEQLFARPFNWEKGQLTGEGVLVSNSMLGGPSFSVSRNGLIAFRHTRGSRSQLAWFNRVGTQLSTSAEPGDLRYPRISPDQKTVVFVRREAGSAEIWLLDRNQNKSTRFTDDRGLDGFPVWSPDSSRIIYLSQRQNERLLVERPANIIGLESVLFRTPGRASESFRLLMVSKLPTGLSPDGRWIIASEWFGSSSIVWLIPRNGNGGPIRFTEGADATVSPDGHWLLFATSGPAGAAGIGLPEVFVEFLPRDLDASREAQRKWQISTGGGANPTWRGDGKEIFYLALDGKMMSVPVESGENFFHPGSPRPLFQTQLAPGGLREYDVTRDGKRFVLNLPLPETRDEPITVIVNWPKLLEK